MRLSYILLAFVLVISIIGCQARSSNADKQIVKNLDEINNKLSILAKELGNIKEKLSGAEVKPPPKKPVKYDFRKPPDLRRLRKIKLAKNPSSKEAEKYIKEIIAASKGQKWFSPNDPQIMMIAKVGSKNVDLLIDNIKNYHVYCALSRAATEDNKKQILEAFKKHHELILCITEKDWLREAKETIIEYLKKGAVTGYNPQIWASAAVRVASPKEYGIIEDYFAHAGNPEMVFNILSQLDGFDMKKAAAKGWEYQKSKRNSWSKSQMAIIAARFGDKDALKYLAYNCGKEKNQYMAAQMRNAIYELTGKCILPVKMERWYDKNEAELVFDPRNGEYVIKAKTKNKEKNISMKK